MKWGQQEGRSRLKNDILRELTLSFSQKKEAFGFLVKIMEEWFKKNPDKQRRNEKN